MNNTKRITQLKNTIFSLNNATLQAWFYILKHSPTDLWEQPALTFITNILNKSTGTLPDDEIDKCALFLCNLARTIYGKSLDNELLRNRTIQQEMEQAQRLAEQSKIYKPKIVKIMKRFELPKRFVQKLNGNIPKELQWGLCAIVSCTRNFDNPAMQKTNLKKPIWETVVVEQFFPNKWSPDFPNGLNEWTTERIQKSLQTIGNLALIEQDIHRYTSKIHKGNFAEKRINPKTGKGYRDSIFEDFRTLYVVADKIEIEYEWDYYLWQIVQKDAVERLTWFFSGLCNYPIIF
jgi:hypothetical protein